MGSDEFRAACTGALDGSTDAKISDDAPERVRSFVEDVDDVPGVDASARATGDDFARVSIDFEYGDRHEYGTGNVAVVPESNDPVGRSAFDHGLRIVRASPFPDRTTEGQGFVDYWFAPREAYDEVEEGVDE